MSAAARYLIVMTDSTSRMLEELHALSSRDLASVRELFARYGCELLM